MTDMDPAEYKQGQRDLYAGNAAGWDKWAEALAEQAERLNAPLIDAAGIGPGSRVLDLASGAGEPALTAARRAEASGHVTATDLTPEMLAIVRRRAEAAGLSNMAFEVADMEELPFPDNSFDAVISRFGVMYSTDPVRTFAEANRVLKPGGRAAYMVWGPNTGNSMLWTVLKTANAELKLFTEEEEQHPFCYGGKGSLAPLMEEGGLRDAAEQDVVFEPKIKLGTPFWTPLLEMNFQGPLADLDKDGKAALDAAVADAFKPHIEGDVYRVGMHVRIGVATAA
ncbi:MAG: methyltransferase domain-containing protein [Minwuiales bacterium]|nr:methyltransferase domain-containing protein [Minwuiales bacterium]